MNDSGEDDDIDGTTVLELIRLGGMLRRFLDRELMAEETGVSAVETCLLRLIATQPLSTASKVAREMGVTRQSMRTMLLDLEARDAVLILEDRVGVPRLLELTSEGDVLRSLGLANAQDLEQKLIGRADPEIRETLRDLVSALLRRTRYRPWRFERYADLD
jgi:DNA-binding MarR family transcriptional regulator